MQVPIRHKKKAGRTLLIFRLYWQVLAAFMLTLFISCEDFVQVDLPNNRVIKANAFGNDKTATGAITGIYHEMILGAGFAGGEFMCAATLSGLSSDELISHFFVNELNRPDEFYQNSLSASNTYVFQLWSTTYATIYAANTALEGLEASNELTPSVKAQLTGEARFIRAFSYFYLVNLFGDVPWTASTDYRINTLISRTPAEQVYAHIIDDLLDARVLLGEQYVTDYRVRPNNAAAAALLARVYLYAGEWGKAENEATFLIEHPQYNLTGLDSVFLTISKEAIWQLPPVVPWINTNEAGSFLAINESKPFYASLTPELTGAFEEGDARLENWIDVLSDGATNYYRPYKYKAHYLNPSAPEEYSVVLRLAEQYLIRAEARARLGNLSDGWEDLNVIRSRAGLEPIEGGDVDALLMAIEKERRLELFTEGAHRWFDLKRTGRATAVLGSIKEKWQPTDVLYPIPQQEMDLAPNLKPQNDGY